MKYRPVTMTKIKSKTNKKLNNSQVFVAIINKQLEPWSLTYEEVKKDKNWYCRLERTEEEEQAWIKWGVKFIRNNAKSLLWQKSAKRIMDEFCNWGIPVEGSERYNRFKKTPRIC